MKKNIIISCFLSGLIALTAFGWMTEEKATKKMEQLPCRAPMVFKTGLDDNFNTQSKTAISYAVGSRFNRTFTKAELKNVRSIADFVDNIDFENVVFYDSVSVIVLDHQYNFTNVVNGNTQKFNNKQLELLKAVPYSTDILIRADFQQKNSHAGTTENNYTTPHITVVPEKQATYSDDFDRLVNYIKMNTEQLATTIAVDELRPGKVRFSVTTQGLVSNVFLESTSGHDEFDKKVLQLITNLPGNWSPAENEHGEKVNQQLVFTFGIIGC